MKLKKKEIEDPISSESDSSDDEGENIVKTNVEPESDGSTSSSEEENDVKEREKPKASNNAIKSQNKENTIFVGNLPTNTKLKQLKQLYKTYGDILSVRFRSENGKKVLNKTDRKKYTSLNAYVVFKDHESALKAVESNGMQFKENHIRCNLASEKQKQFNDNINMKSTIFVGNVTFETTDEELYQFFNEKCNHKVDYVRRVPKKGFAFVSFKKGFALVTALKLNNTVLNGRPLRIQRWEAKDQILKKNKKQQKKDSSKKSIKKPKTLDTSRPTRNPLIQKIREKSKSNDEVSKAEFKKKFRKSFDYHKKDDETKGKKKNLKFHGLRTDNSNKKAKKKKIQDKKFKKIASLLTGGSKSKK